MTGISRFFRGSALFGASLAIGAGAALVPTPSFADLQVGGSAKAVTIDAQNTSIKEILDTLSKQFDVHFQSTANLQKQITGTYEGSLPKVLIRILEGYNVIMKTGKDRIQVTVLGTKNSSTAAGGTPEPVVTGATAPPSAASAPVEPSSIANHDIKMPSAPAGASPPPILLAEGPPPTASPPSSSFPQVQPSTVAAPTPTAGSGQTAFPVGKPTTTIAPGASGSAAVTAPAPQPGNATTAAPVAK